MHNPLKTVSPDQLDRRTVLKGITLGAGAVVLQYPNYETAGNRTIANFYLSLLHAVGDRRKRFGERDPNMNEAEQAGPLAEIMA